MSAHTSPPDPSAAPSLTRELLFETVGPWVYKHGQSALARRRVIHYERTTEGLLIGLVRGRNGRKVYRVRVGTDAEGLLCVCECSVWSQEGSCEHAVALVLASLGDGSEPPPVSKKEKAAGLPRTLEARRSWLEAHHLTHAYREPFSVLEPYLPKRVGSYLLARMSGESLQGLLEGTSTLRLSFMPDAQAQLEAAAWKWLRAEAERVRRGLERERASLPRPPPTDARLVPLVEALERARAHVREVSVPRLLDGKPLIYFQEQPPRFSIDASGRSADSGRGGFPLVERVAVDPVALLEGGPGLVCPCAPGEEARCVHALTALDALLDVLADPAEANVHARLAEVLFEWPVKRLLTALETAAASRLARTEAGSAGRVTFRCEFEPDGQVSLKPYLHKPLKRGGFSKGSAVALWGGREVLEALGLLVEPEHREALELCRVMARLKAFQQEDARALLVRALRLLARGACLFLDSRLDTPLRVREAPLGFAFEEGEDGGLRVRPTVGGEAVPSEALRPPPGGGPWLLLEPHLPRLTLVEVPPEALPVLKALRESGGRLPGTARKKLLEQLAGLEASFPVALPESMEGRPVEPVPGVLLRLRPLGEDSLEAVPRVRPLPEAPPLPPGEGAPVVRGVRAGERVMVRRNLPAERAEAEALRERLELPAASEAGGAIVLEGAEAALGFLERLEPLRDSGLRVEWEERAWTVRRVPDAAGLRVEVARGRDWFGVRGGMEVDGERVELAVLLDALRRRRRYVPLGPGRWLRLTEALREQLGPLADLAHPTRQGLEVSAAAAPVLDALEEAGAQVKAPPDWRRLAGRIREAQARQVPVPRGLKAKLRDYQREGFVWMARLAEWGGGGCLADDMGLGKTLQALALLLHRAKAGPALVVAPTSVCFNWVREAERFAPGLRVHSYREAEREALLGELRAGDVLVVSYGLLVRDAERFAEVSFATLVVDEAQAVKNPDTARAKALRGLKAGARVALSGTPVENRLSELWSLFQIVFPGLLGSREAFRERFAAPIERERDAGARAGLARVVRPFLLRRTKAQVARELPERIETVVPVTLSEAERRLYEDARLAALARLADAGPEKRFEVLAALTRLRLLACHPRLGDADSAVPSSKLERFLERLEEVRAEGGRALVFSQFVKHLSLVREALEARGVPYQYLDGKTPAAEREARVAAFQRGAGEAFLISVKAGGTGLNLTAADHVIHLDPWWNPAVEDQATDRAHRMGQTRTVTVSRLVAEGTIEEAILALHAEKRELANSLLSEADGAAALSTEQLLDLLRFNG